MFGLSMVAENHPKTEWLKMILYLSPTVQPGLGSAGGCPSARLAGVSLAGQQVDCDTGWLGPFSACGPRSPPCAPSM